MYKKVIFCFLCLCFSVPLTQAQSIKPIDLVNKATDKVKKELILFRKDEISSSFSDKSIQYHPISISKEANLSILKSSSEFLELSFPVSKNENLTLSLVEVDLFSNSNYVYTEPGMKKVDIDMGKHYRGVVKGIENTIVAVSIYKDETSVFVSGLPIGNLAIAKSTASSQHYAFLDNKNPEDFIDSCSTPDEGIAYTKEQIRATKNSLRESDTSTRCVNVSMEVDYDVFQRFETVEATTNFMTSIMNQVLTVYANENVSLVLKPFIIWTEVSPYSGSNALGMLQSFAAYRTQIDGDLSQLVSFRTSGGVAASTNALCSSQTSRKLSFSRLKEGINEFPTYTYSVFVVSHELGHSLGSRHTHACYWNGNGTALDGCHSTEGICPTPAVPEGGGTIMSYCHNKSTGINFAKGFGEQPGNVIRAKIENSNCLTTCGEEEEVGCVETTNFVLEIQFDNYPREIKWEILDSSGAVIEQDGPYTNQEASSFISEEITIVTNGEYTFKISDSNSDGICCSYGEGFYKLKTSDGTLLGIGSNFNGEDIVNFCVDYTDNEVPSTPSNLEAINTNYTSTELQWDISTDNVEIDFYNIYQDNELVASTPSHNFTVTNLEENTTYTYDVTAVDSSGNESLKSNKINVTTLYLDDEAPSIPKNLIALSTTINDTELKWNPSTDNIELVHYEIYKNNSLTAITDETNYFVTNLVANTSYEFYVIAVDGNGNRSEASNTVYVTTLIVEQSNTNPVYYCFPTNNFTKKTWINYVKINSISNRTDFEGLYSDYSTQETTIKYGRNSIYFQGKYNGTKKNRYWSIWIDYNQDGIFSTDERILNYKKKGKGLQVRQFNIPESALEGKTRLRVSFSNQPINDPCVLTSFGETEDYTINIETDSKGDSLIEQTDYSIEFFLFPNPVRDKNITIQSSEDLNGSYQVFNSIGALVHEGEMNGIITHVQLPKLNAGMYFMRITDEGRTTTKKFVVE